MHDMTTQDDFALIARIRRDIPGSITVEDALNCIKMIRDGNMVHVDQIEQWVTTQRLMGINDAMVDAAMAARAVA
jgi:hypothetical protein